ncbi:hypothetical protein AB0M45_08480 [Nocardia sp. NPDC051787]|uniref:hypothetical protein n=1 Tax=Nocardia sp. NPDC051787 TaxID=3155415 RepID=UPI003424FD1D
MPTDTTRTQSRLAHSLAAGRDRAFVGRRAELEWFAGALEGAVQEDDFVRSAVAATTLPR